MIKFISLVLVISNSFLYSYATENTTQETPIASTQLQRFSLSKQIPKASDFDVRMRKITVKSGAKIAKHGHKERAGMVYVVSGEIVEFRHGKALTLKPGNSIVEDFDTVHSYENQSDKDCILIAFDLPKEQNTHN